MVNLYQIWDKEVQGLDSVGAKPEQIEARRQAIAAHFEQKARQAGMSSKDIYATLGNFDTYSRQKTSRFDDGLTPDEREAARDDGSTILGLNKGGLKEGAKAIKDLGLGIVSSVPRVVGDLAQTWSDVGDNDSSELSAQLARKAYDASEDIKSNYSEGTKQRKKDFWSPTGLAMGVGENLGQMALSAGLVGGATKGAMALSKGSKAWGLGAGLTTGMGLAYGQGYGQGKENALEKINRTSNEDLYANVVAEYDDWQKNGAKKSSKPEIVSLYEEAEGDLDAMKGLMAENAGNLTGLLTAATAPIAMGATAFANRGIVNEMARQGTGNIITRNLAFQTGARDSAEFARRVAARDAIASNAGATLGAKLAANAAIARQGAKMAGKQTGLQTVEEGAQEWGEGYFAADAGSLARGDKGVLSDKDWSEVNQQGLQGAAIGALMGGGGSLLTMRDAQNTGIAQAKARTALPKQYQDSFNAFEDAKQAEAQAQAAYEANPTPESEEALAQATDARLKANNQFSQYDAAFKQTFTEQEQQDLLSNDLKGIAARAKLEQEAKQAELNSKAEQEALAKAQRANMVKGLAAYADNESVLINEVNQLGLDDTQKELLLREVFAESKNAKAKPQQTQAKTPLELAVDEHFDAKGNRKPSVISPDVADKHKVSLNELLPAIAKRNNDIKIQKAQAEKQAKVDAFNKSQAQQKTKDVQREQLAEQQQLENILADFAAENDTESMLSMLEGYDKAEADKLFNNAFKTVETRAKEAEKATKTKEAETAKQAQAKQKQSAFNADMSALYESNPNATYNDWKAVGKKHGVTSAIDLANAWASAKSNKPKQKSTETLALPSPNNIMVTDAQGNTTPTTENNAPKKQRNADVSVPSGLNVDVSNAANTQRDRGVGSYSGSASNLIVRQDGKPFPTEQVAQQALTNKTTKKTKAKKNEPAISKDTHTVVPVDGGFAIAPVEQVEPVAQQEAKAEPKQEAAPEKTDDITGQYTHSQFPDATATVTKTDKGYDVDWGDEVQSFTGKNAADKTQAALKKENFNKKNPDDDNGGVAVEPVAPKPKPVSPSGGVIPRVHLDRISRGLKDGKTVEEIATKIQKSLPHLTIEDVTQQVLAAQEKASKPATLDSIIGKYSDDEEVDEKIRQSGEVLKKFLPETIGDWKIDKSTFATRGAWSVSYTKPRILIDRKTGKEVVSATTSSAPLDGDVLLSGDEQAIKEHINMRLAKNGITPKGVKDWRLDDTVSPTGQQVVDNTPTKPVSPMVGNNTPQTTPNTTGEQIAEAMDKTAQAITEAAHNKVVERVKNGEEIVYKQPAAIERVKQDEPVTAESSHIDNGKIEEVTGEVIRESLAKADDKPINGRTMSLKEAKQWLLDSIDKAIAVAKYKTNIDVFGRNGEKNPKNTDYVDFDVPNDGKFKVLNTIESLQKFKANIEKTKGFTENQKPVKPFSAPSENSPETTISNFLADGELENAYFFAENQDKPIKFTLSEKGEPIAYFLTEPVDLGNGIKGFVGLAANGVNKEGRKNWLVIEEKSRKSIGFEEASKQAAIKSAKARLSSLKKEDLEGLAAKITPINKTDEEMKADWLAKNNIKIDEQSNEENSINRKTENLAPVEKAQQAKKDAFLNTEIDSQYGKVTKRQLIDNLINDGWTLTTGWTEDKAKGKALDAELDRLKRTAPIGNSSHPDTVRLNELKNLAKESPHKERGQFFFKETTYRLESPTGQLKQLSKTELDYVNEVLANKEPQPVAAEQESAKTEEKPAEKPASKTPLLDKNNNFMDLVRDGKATAEQFKQSFDDLFANKDAVIAELNTLTKDQLFKEGSYNIQYRYKNDKKSVIAEAVYREMIARYSLGRGISYGMGKNSYENAVKKMVDDTDQSRLDDFAKEYKQMIDDRAKEITEKAEALKNPQTLEDYRNLVRSKMADGSTRQEAFLSLTPEQRIKYDELEAESTKETREAKKRALQSTVNTASQTTTGTIIETKHTRDGYDLFVVQLSDRLSTDDYKQVLSEAKRLGGWYSSFRGNGAIAGFQFKDKGSAEAFLALAGGDTTAAKEQIDAKIDAFEDNRSQTAVERLQAMADKLEEKANEELNRDRLVNTARRARFAASAEFAARSQIALAKTMRNIADAISSGKAKFLDNIRMKTDVETLQSYIASAKDSEIRAKYKTYGEQEKRKGQPATVETADFATYPSYTLYRSDLAMLGRKLLEIEGLKKFGQQIMAVADDVSDAYLEFAKKNLHQVSRFSKGDSSLATFSSKDIAERSIRKSGLTGKAIVLQVKRGENIIILSPSEAINLKVWEGDADKRITLKREFGNDLVNAVGRRAGKNNNLLPYQFQLNYDKFKSLSRMGIETPSEFRSALREFIALQEEATNNKVREMELAMVGRKNDGLDFFPTPQVITQQMIEAAEITPDMAVLEPSAGMGHIADMIRATGAEPDVIEMSGERRELLKEKGYHLAETNDFMDMQPRKFFTYGDVFRAPDGKEGVMRGSSGQRVMLLDSEGNSIGYYNRDELEGVRHQGVDSGYDRIIMNPPFSNRQDAEHVRHAYDLLKPNGRIVAIMGEGVFFGSDKKAVEFREWLDSVGGTSEKLPDNSFMDKSLPVNTGVNARMVVIDKQESNNQDTDNKPKFSKSSTIGDRTITQVRDKLISRFGKRIVEQLESKGILKIHQSMSDKDIPADALRQLAWHGSPHKFDKFSLEHLGKGEGAQAYGWGLYFASKKAVSEWYRKNLTAPDLTTVLFKGKKYSFTDGNADNLVNDLTSYYGFNRRIVHSAIMEMRKHGSVSFAYSYLTHNVENKTKEQQDVLIILTILHNELFNHEDGQLYEVNIPEDDTMLLWDKPLSESPKFVIDALRKAKLVQPYEIEEMTGEEFYKDLYAKAGSRLGIKASDKAASKLLNSLGITGIKYLDGTSRFAGDGSYNYVVFDDSAVEILKTYYSKQQGVTEGFYFNGTVHLIADNLTDESIIPTFVHELGGHKGFQEMMSPKAYELIMQQFDRLVAQGNSIAIKAKQRAEKAEKDTARQQDEYIPYLLTEQEKAQFATPQERNAVKRLIDHIVRAIKGWVVRTLSKYNATAGIGKRVSETLDARDIQLMAERMIKDIAKRGGDNNNSPKFSKTEQSQFDQLLAKADKMIAEQGKLLAPNGKPSKLNRYQWAQVRTDNFKQWFGDWENDPENASKVVDENGEPMVVYHGSQDDINIFEGNRATKKDAGWYGRGVYFTADPVLASAYSESEFEEIIQNKDAPPNSNVIPVYLNIRNPYFWPEWRTAAITHTDANVIRNGLAAAGLDGVIVANKYADLAYAGFYEVIAFESTQIKSAIGNNGEFNPTNPDIRFSKSIEVKGTAKSGGLSVAEAQKVADAFMSDYNGNIPLTIRVVEKQEDAYGEQGTTDKIGKIDGTYHPKSRIVVLVASSFHNSFEARRTLRHEILGHYGINTFKPVDKQELLEKIIASRNAPILKGVWARVDRDYADISELKRAEEVFAFVAERELSPVGQAWNDILNVIYKALRAIGIVKSPLSNAELNKLARSIAKGIRNGTRQQQTFPKTDYAQFSRAEDKAKAAKDYVLDSVRIKRQVAENLHAKAELGWWSKTIGTQLNTAKKFKDFDRVYKLLQRLLQHQSSDVMDALEVAPTLLEKLDDWQDLKNQVKAIGRNAWQGLKHKLTDAVTDRMAVAKVIFGETLAKKPLSQAELEQKLTPQQLKIYEEARAAINVSLKNTAKSEIIRSLLQAEVINFDTVEKLLNQQTGFDAFIDEMLENVGARISNAQEELSQAETDVEKQAIKDELKRLADMYNSISDVNTKVYKLIDEAYAPLMRFGDYALTMRDKTTGKVLSFMMFESKAERNRMVNYLGTEYGDTVTLETDTMSTEDFKMFKGVTPETVALFAKELGLDKNEAYQGYLKLAIPATSALTRRIQRKGTAGYNEDIQRVVSAFVMSNARYSSKNIYLDKVNQAHSEIDSGTSVRDQAKKMIDNTIDPADTFAWLRDLLFVWNLGGSVMFAFLNMTQPFMQTLPMLSQYVNTGFATKHVLRGIGVAGKAMATGNAPKGYEAEYKRAVHEGIVDPQNTFMLTGLERGGTGTTSKVWTGTKHILGIFAQMSESLNRKAVFIASLEVANAKGGAWLKQKGYASAYDFAVDVIAQTQGVYNKANRSNWAHSQLGAPLLVFKQFSINYVEQMVRMWKNQSAGEEGKKAVLLAMMMLFSLAGGMGLPFIKDIFDGSETIAAFMGNPVNIEREMRLMGKQYLGETTTGALMDGWLNKLVIGEVLGSDVQSRTGMGDLIPATNFFNKTIYGTDQQVSEGMSIFGAAGGLGEKVVDSLNFMANDEFGDAFINILPRFATSMVRGTEMMATGKTTDSKGRKLFDVTFGEGLVKFLDSQPVRMAELSRARGLEYDDIAIQRSKIDYYKKKWIKAAQKEDDEAIEQIEQDIEDWNENNEKYPVIFDRQRAYQSANKNEMTWGEREERTPKGMDWLNEERPDWLNEQ